MTGRPSLYQTEFIQEARDLALLGLTDEELANHFGIATSTLYDWKNKYPEFSEAIKNGKTPADAHIANKLYDRAAGAEWVEEQAIKLKSIKYQDGRKVSEEERIEVVEVTRRAPPDTTAAIFWLKNRKSDVWRDRTQTEVNVRVSLEDALERIRRSRPEIIDGTAERLPDIRAGLLAHQGQDGPDQPVQSEPRAEILTPEA